MAVTKMGEARRTGLRRRTRTLEEIHAIRESLYAPAAAPAAPKVAPRRRPRSLGKEHARLVWLRDHHATESVGVRLVKPYVPQERV